MPSGKEAGGGSNVEHISMSHPWCGHGDPPQLTEIEEAERRVESAARLLAIRRREAVVVIPIAISAGKYVFIGKPEDVAREAAAIAAKG